MAEYIDDFHWAVPKAYINALTLCLFGKGDILYSNSSGYKAWGDASAGTECIQVKTAPVTDYIVNSNDVLSTQQAATSNYKVFKSNWDKELTIEIFKLESMEKETITTTQGHLFSFLWKGDRDFLSSETNHTVPLMPGKIKLTKYIDSIKKALGETDKNDVIFVMPYSLLNSVLASKFLNLRNKIKKEFKFNEVDISLQEAGIDEYQSYLPTTRLKCFVANTTRIEGFRDIVKEALWPVKKSNFLLKDILKGDNKKIGTKSNISNHGLFISPKKRKFVGQELISFDHSPFYRYRLDCDKIDAIDMKLCTYLTNIFTDCPNHLFKKSARTSDLCCSLKRKFCLSNYKKHELIDLAERSREFTKYKSRHENLQKYFLDNDPYSIAVEIPLWLEPGEFVDYNKFWGTNQTITGHIDLLRYNENKVEVWDYKPNAADEWCAAHQVFIYTISLACRTGLPITMFKCGYFDEKNLYEVDWNVAE